MRRGPPGACPDRSIGMLHHHAITRCQLFQPEPEPERSLLRLSDHWSFMSIGVPAVGFIFARRHRMGRRGPDIAIDLR
jgi:hypothetical protein